MSDKNRVVVGKDYPSKSVKYLGINIYENLNWKD